MVYTVFKTEVNRVLFNIKSVIFLLCLLIVTLYLVNAGIGEYKDFLKNTDAFLKYEKGKVEKYLTYDQYGGFGFGVLFKPSPLMVFFKNSGLFNQIESNVDVKEIVDVYDVKKGRSLFNTGVYKDFAGVIFMFGSLYFLLMGMCNFKSDRYINFSIRSKNIPLSVLFRLLLLTITFAIIFLLNFFWVNLGGISFSATEINVFILFFFYSIIFLIFFYSLGMLIASIFKSKKMLIGLIGWFMLIFIIPELMRAHIFMSSKKIPANEVLNFQKFETLLDKEKVFHSGKFKGMSFNSDPQRVWKPLAMKFWEEVYNENLKREKEFNDRVYQIIDLQQKWAIILPSLYFDFLSNEVSSRGYLGYSDFVNYILKIRDEFMKFYIEKRYLSESNEIESFVKSAENIFDAKSQIPVNFRIGWGLTCLYSLILLGMAWAIWIKRLKRIPEIAEKPELEIKKGTSHFIFCKTADYRDKLYKNLIARKNVIGLDKVRSEDIDVEVHPHRAVEYLSKIHGVEESVSRKNLDTLGVKAADLKEKKPSPESLKKIYAAVILATRADIYIVNDFLKGETKDFEKSLYVLFTSLKERGGMVVYLSDQFLSAMRDKEEKWVLEKIEFFKLIPFIIEEYSVR